jgi:hypothetical protein
MYVHIYVWLTALLYFDLSYGFQIKVLVTTALCDVF